MIKTRDSKSGYIHVFPNIKKELNFSIASYSGEHHHVFSTYVRKKNDNGVFCLIPVIRKGVTITNDAALIANHIKEMEHEFLQECYLAILYYRIPSDSEIYNPTTGEAIVYIDNNQEEEIDRLQPWRQSTSKT